jgi:hypothetical protein
MKVEVGRAREGTSAGRTWAPVLALAFGVTIGWLGTLSLPQPVQAGYELPPGERITNLPHIPRSMPQKESYEVYDPVIGRNFDLKNFWMRADLRVRPEYRNGVCFGGGAPVGGACNGFNPAAGTATRANQGRGASDFYVQQWARLGIGYDLSDDVNFYFELIDSTNWGSNGNANNAGNGGDPLNHDCGSGGAPAGLSTNCGLGVRAAYVLVRNLGGVQGLSMKAGRQYVVFGNHSLFGHFDWANTGYSHDGIMFSYSTKVFDSYLGWFRSSETDLGQAAPVGSLAGNIGGCRGGAGANPPTNTNCAGSPDGGADADMFIFYNQIKSVPGFLIEPFYVLYMNGLNSTANSGQGIGTPKHSNQIRHMLGNRTEMRKGNWDFINETAWQFGRMGDGVNFNNDRNLTINAWATRNWLGYTLFEHSWKPRVAIGFDYASGDGNANCAIGATASAGYQCKTANTFENFFPTNYIHEGYMLNHAWRNSIQPQVNLQARPTPRDHIEFWGQLHYLANARDNWYRGAQGVLSFSKPDNTVNHVGNEVDFAWTHMFADGKVSLTATYGHFMVGKYVKENLGTNSDQDWGIIQLWMNF